MQNFLNQLLYGFRKAHSIQHALFSLIQSWQKELDQSRFVGIILRDLSKAYDCLPHDLMVTKLEVSSLAKESLQFISDYLNYRGPKLVLHIVTGPFSFTQFLKSLYWDLYFSIFLINDIFLVVAKSDICNFAEDNILYSHGSNLPLILRNFEHDIMNLLYWFKVNSLMANPEKF